MTSSVATWLCKRIGNDHIGLQEMFPRHSYGKGNRFYGRMQVRHERGICSLSSLRRALQFKGIGSCLE